jgi:hypothetical protein
MKLYCFLRQYLNPTDASILVGVWYAFLIFLIFIGLSQIGTDFRYANL